MKILRNIQAAFISIFLELPARVIGMEGLLNHLENSRLAFQKRMQSLSGRPNNQKILAHIIGIERWGQRRIRVALGELQIDDEYDPYLPPEQDWQFLQEAFLTTRQATIGLGKSLRMAGIDPHMRIQHNQFGAISVLGWLYYLNLHARIESFRFN